MDRAIAPGFVLRRVILREVAQEQRLSEALLGVDRPRRRRGITIVLAGSLDEFVAGRELRVGAGQMLVVPEMVCRAGLCTGDVLELDWDPGALGDRAVAPTPCVVRLGQAAFDAAKTLARALSSAAEERDTIAGPFIALQRALASEGLAFDTEVLFAPTPRADQIVHALIDRQLCSLDTSPMMVDMDELGLSRRTLTRRVTELQARYGLWGESWRALRDRYRLVVASVLLSHAEATPRSVASIVGYGSVEALDHAFRHAGMMAPAAFQRRLRRV